MKIRFGALVVGAIGKAGGQCIQRHKEQFILRNITVPTQTLQTRSNPNRKAITTLSQAWANVNPEEMESWAYAATLLSTFNKWGDPVVLSPRQAFTKLNMTFARLADGPYTYEFQGRIVAEYDFNYTEIIRSLQVVNFSIGNRSGDAYAEYSALPIRNENVNPPPYKLKTLMLVMDASPTPHALYLKLQERCGSIQPFQWFALGFRFASRDGIMSTMKIIKMRVTAS